MDYAELATECGDCQHRDRSRTPRYSMLPCKLAGIEVTKNKCLRHPYGRNSHARNNNQVKAASAA